jgi:hypothetical protein
VGAREDWAFLLQQDLHHFFGSWPGKNAKQGTP